MFKISKPQKQNFFVEKKKIPGRKYIKSKQNQKNSSNSQNSKSTLDMESQNNKSSENFNNINDINNDQNNNNNNIFNDNDNIKSNSNNSSSSDQNLDQLQLNKKVSSLQPGSHGIPHNTKILKPEDIDIEESQQLEEQNSQQQLEDEQKKQEDKLDDKLLDSKKKVKGISVYARIRPLAVGVDQDKQFGYNSEKMIEIKNKNKEILLKEQNSIRKFKFDKVFDDQTTQQEIYEQTTQSLVDKLFEGYNCAILVYGQSGSGKTHTMLGQGFDNIENIKLNNKQDQGLVPRFMDSIFYKIYAEEDNDITYDIRASYIEIYNESIRDLLFPQNNNLNICSEPNSGLLISNATQVPITCSKDVLNLIENGSKIRKIAKTNLNEHSSRSHAIVIITIFTDNIKSGVKKAAQLYMTDLAGSENVGRAQGASYTDVQVKEAGKINQSLLTLGNVIAALIDKSKHIPYRNSKLTRLLQNAFGGNSYTSLILNVSQNPENYFQTLGTLQFGDRANKVQNNPNSNVEMGEKQLRKMYDRVCQQLIKQNEHLKQYKSVIGKQQFLIKKMFNLINPTIQQSLLNQYSIDLTFLTPTDQILSKDQKGILKLYGNCFAYVFTFLHPIDIMPLFTVCKAFNQRLKSEYLWKTQLDFMKQNNPEFEYNQQNINSYYIFFKNISLQQYWKIKKQRIQSKQVQNLQLFQKK